MYAISSIICSVFVIYGLLLVLTNINSTRINKAYRKAVKCMNEQLFKDAVVYLNGMLAMWPAPDLILSSWKKQRSIFVAQRAYCYSHLNEYDLAQADCNKAIALDPKSATAYAHRGANFYSQDRLDEALTDMNVAVNLLMDNPIPPLGSTQDENIWKLWPVLNRAMVYEKMGQLELALKDYELAKHLVPQLKFVDKNEPISDHCELCRRARSDS